MTERPTILLAAAQPLFRAGLRAVLAGQGFDVVADAADADAAVEAAEGHRPNACVLEADLPGGAVVAVRRIVDRAPGTAVVVLETELTPENVLAAVRAGANGIVSASTPVTGLTRAVHSVLEGQASIPRAAIAALVHEFRGSGPQRASLGGRALVLTEREAQVLELLRENLTTAQLAAELGVSQVTVRRHLASIAAKAGKAGRRELLRLVQVA